MTTPNLLSATEAAAAIAAGKLTSETLVRACLDRIRAREADVEAWAYLDPELALAQARQRDRETPRSRLHGIPIGVKDVIDTADMPTEYGSPIYKDHKPSCDAACVAQVRELGGVILGKTVTTEFATRYPSKTRNPKNLDHTPGGSSAGSAAAVADGMVPIAFGTQTSSSIVRPAAYCGVVGYKPTFNLVNRAGLKFLAESLDTIGVLTRTVPDAAMIVEALSGSAPARFEEAAALQPRIGFCRTPYWDQADAATQSALLGAIPLLGRAGARVEDVALDSEFAELSDAQIRVSSYEFYRALTYERTRFPQLISDSLMTRIRGGSLVTRAEYEKTQALAAGCRAKLVDVYRQYDVLICPSATGEAPRGLTSTGDPVFGLTWTLMQGPAVTLPVFTGPAGLPIGLQVTGPRGSDARTLIAAEWIRRALAA
jgi:Asp-tRNA(Asn)/Glu-tRNA(Gln) amidotransferase A subunit family amidase